MTLGRQKGQPPPNKGHKYPAEPLTEAEVAALLRQCSARAPTGVRNRAMLVVMYRGGLRIGETLALFPKDVDRDAGTVRILSGKGKKARVVGLDPAAFAFIERWLDVRKRHRLTGRKPLFCTLQGKPISAPYVRMMLARIAAKAGIDKRVHPHGLRHTHTLELASEGTPINTIQLQLGHGNASTTSSYIQKLSPQVVIETMWRRTWGGAPKA